MSDTPTRRRQSLVLGCLVVTLVGVACFGTIAALLPAVGGCAGMLVGFLGSVVGAGVARGIVLKLGFPRLSDTQEGLLAVWAGLKTAWFVVYCLFAGFGLKLSGA